MRKVALTSLFLVLFNISGQNSPGLPETSDEPFSKDRANNDKLIQKINYAITENRGIGLTWSDNMPLFSPLRTDKIKYISDCYGMRENHPVLHIRKFHFGIDFCANLGTSIHATANGIVEKVQRKKCGYGFNIIINHGDGYKTRYAHLNEIFVKEGDAIKLDDIIGTVGSTGMSTGNHLHYEIIYNNNPIDPMAFYFDGKTKDKTEYVSILIDLERTTQQLLNNNNSFWEQAGIPSQIQDQT